MATTVVVQLRGSLANRALDLSNRVGGTATAVMTNRSGRIEIIGHTVQL
jgi:hypothetical protein